LGAPLQARDVVSTFVDALVLAEPLQARLWKATGLTLTQLRILRALREQPTSAGELAEIAGVSAASLTRVLTRLEERDLIGRAIDRADRRRVQVSITPAGRAALPSGGLWKGSAFQQAAHHMSYTERRAFVTALRAFLERVRAVTSAEPDDARLAVH
jgi:DNA-binding MarR family transcriptional regulator